MAWLQEAEEGVLHDESTRKVPSPDEVNDGRCASQLRHPYIAADAADSSSVSSSSQGTGAATGAVIGMVDRRNLVRRPEGVNSRRTLSTAPTAVPTDAIIADATCATASYEEQMMILRPLARPPPPPSSDIQRPQPATPKAVAQEQGGTSRLQSARSLRSVLSVPFLSAHPQRAAQPSDSVLRKDSSSELAVAPKTVRRAADCNGKAMARVDHKLLVPGEVTPVEIQLQHVEPDLRSPTRSPHTRSHSLRTPSRSPSGLLRGGAAKVPIGHPPSLPSLARQRSSSSPRQSHDEPTKSHSNLLAHVAMLPAEELERLLLASSQGELLQPQGGNSPSMRRSMEGFDADGSRVVDADDCHTVIGTELQLC